MSRIREINVDEGWARVQPGSCSAELNQYARQPRPPVRHRPLDPNRATIGGGVGNNSCGAHSIVYGKTIDKSYACDAILSDALGGHLRAGRRQRPRRQSSHLPDPRGTPLPRDAPPRPRSSATRSAKRYPKILRRVSGYNLDDFMDEAAPMDLSRMIVGSEGTLAVVTEAKVKLQTIPKVQGRRRRPLQTLVEAGRRHRRRARARARLRSS